MLFGGMLMLYGHFWPCYDQTFASVVIIKMIIIVVIV